MLLDIKSEDYLRPFSKLFWIGAPILVLLAIFFIYKLYTAIGGDQRAFANLSSNYFPEKSPENFGGIKIFSENLLTKYLFAFEYVSTLLFAAIVAVISIVQLDWKGRKNE